MYSLFPVHENLFRCRNIAGNSSPGLARVAVCACHGMVKRSRRAHYAQKKRHGSNGSLLEACCVTSRLWFSRSEGVSLLTTTSARTPFGTDNTRVGQTVELAAGLFPLACQPSQTNK